MCYLIIGGENKSVKQLTKKKFSFEGRKKYVYVESGENGYN